MTNENQDKIIVRKKYKTLKMTEDYYVSKYEDF